MDDEDIQEKESGPYIFYLYVTARHLRVRVKRMHCWDEDLKACISSIKNYVLGLIDWP
jgi:N6-adenosine-specific RNA methylase IME4